MDYSIHDDNPAGASPWGSSPQPSPQHTRTSSYPSGEVPPSPTPYSIQPGNANQDTLRAGGYSRPESSAETESVTTESDGRRPDTAQSIRSEPEQQQGYVGQQQQRPPPQQHAQPQRYHQPGRQAQPAPQYKLQAKITGLERTGRKDPILRFDVHVRPQLFLRYHRSSTDLSDQSTKVSHDPISRCPTNPLRIQQAGRSFDFFKP